MRFGEPGAAALARELAEELGHQLRVGDLAFVAENIFAGDGVQHEIGLYYHVDWPAYWTGTICDAGASSVIGSVDGSPDTGQCPVPARWPDPSLASSPSHLKHGALDRSQPQ